MVVAVVQAATFTVALFFYNHTSWRESLTNHRLILFPFFKERLFCLMRDIIE